MLPITLHRIVLACLAATALPAAAVDLSIVSRTSVAVPMDTNSDSSGTTGISDDGRHALFFSDASNLIAGDTNLSTDLFLYDHQEGSIERVNLGSGNVQANADTLLKADLSADARHIVFESRATNLVASDTHGTWQIYLRDRLTQTTTLVSRGLDGSGSTTGGYAPQISADGRYVVFISYDPLVENDFNLSNDVYRYDRVGGTLDLISVAENGEIGDFGSDDARISADGRYVAFRTFASNLFAGDVNFAHDIVLRDTVGNVNVNASIRPGGGQFGAMHDLASGNALSADGRYVLFNTDMAIDPDDNGSFTDGFRYDRVTNQSARVTRGPGGALLQHGAIARALSSDGNVVLMESTGDDLVGFPTLNYRRSYVRDISTGMISPVKVRPGGFHAYDEIPDCGLSGNGAVAYCSTYTRALTDSDQNYFSDFFRSEIGADGGMRVSRPLPDPVAAANGDSGGLVAGASDDGRYVVFDSLAENLVTGDINGVPDVFLRDRVLGTTQRLSVTTAGDPSTCASREPSITPDGRYVVFQSCGALVPQTTGTTVQIYRYDRIGGQLELVSAGSDGIASNGHCRDASISADGNVVAFHSAATNFGVTTPAAGGVFARNLPDGTTTLVNRPPSGTANGIALNARVSGDGRWVYFSDSSSNLVAGDTNGVTDVFAFDRDDGTVHRRSLDPSDQELANASSFIGTSHDGSKVLFKTQNFVCAGSADGLVVRNVADGQARCVSADSVNHIGYVPQNSAAISGDGKRVAFTTRIPRPPYEVPAVETVVLHDLTTGRVHALLPPDVNRYSRILHLCAAGDCLLLASPANNIVPVDLNNRFADVFIAQRLIDGTLFRDGFETVAP
ncbi:hypothetical protein [Tahibacter sp.]|uniref:hypothetical protein n=1 Tax=Tahibacter sp. TaxID=2056211 RepID=UPI0028C43ABF|nr:hypothetical protein [Tahibacter sp.]